jgi:hypothetical protein
MYQEIFQAVKDEEHILISKERLDFSFDNIVRRKSPNSKALTILLYDSKLAGLNGAVYFTKASCPGWYSGASNSAALLLQNEQLRVFCSSTTSWVGRPHFRLQIVF